MAIPTRLVEINDTRGQIDAEGVQREICLDLVPEARIGDYVIVHAGYAIQVLNEDEARKTLALFEEMARDGRES